MNEIQAQKFTDLVNALLKKPSEYREILPALSRLLEGVYTQPTTLGELAKSYGIGTIFEVEDTQENYQLAGYFDGGIAVRSFNSEFLTSLPAETRIRRVF